MSLEHVISTKKKLKKTLFGQQTVTYIVRAELNEARMRFEGARTPLRRNPLKNKTPCALQTGKTLK